MNTQTLFTGFTLLLLIQFVSTWLLGSLGLTFPPALLGMILLALALLTNLIRLAWVEDICSILIAKMGMLFVPAGISILLYLDVISQEALPIFVTIIVTSIIVMVATGLFVELMLRRQNKEEQ
ncbi:MAG: CidA/LrgA family protein [Acidaminococcaceae bacterium]